MIEIKYDIPFEVDVKQFGFLMSNFQMVVAGQTPEDNADKKYKIKVWSEKYIPLIQYYMTNGELPKFE